MSDQETLDLCMAYILIKKRKRKKTRHTKRYWVHPYYSKRLSNGQFHLIFKELRRYPDKFFDYHKMSIDSFDQLLSILQQDIEKENTKFRLSISPAERLSITLRYLTSGCIFSTLAADFLVARNTIGEIIKTVCAQMWNNLQPTEMPTPSQQDWLNVADGFFSNGDFPNCAGAIDAKYIRLFYHQKRSSIVLLAVCDSNYFIKMIDVCPFGDKSESDIFKSSALGKSILNGTINLPAPKCYPNDGTDTMHPFCLIGDESFPLHTNLMRPFTASMLDDAKRTYNQRLERARRKIESTFGILANKWRVLQTPILVSPDFATYVIKACCVLHNFVCGRDGYNFEDTLINPLPGIDVTCSKIRSTNAKHTRSNLVDYFNNKNVLGGLHPGTS